MNWAKIKNEYINGHISYRKLAEKHDISPSTLMQRASREKWADKRAEHRSKVEAKTEQKTVEKVSEHESDLNLRIAQAAGRLLEKIELATEQLDQFIVTNRAKEKTVEYASDEAGFGKPKKEVLKEIETRKVVKTDFLDKQGIKQLASALKDLRDINMTTKEEGAQEDTTVNIIFEAVTPEDIEAEGDE